MSIKDVVKTVSKPESPPQDKLESRSMAPTSASSKRSEPPEQVEITSMRQMNQPKLGSRVSKFAARFNMMGGSNESSASATTASTVTGSPATKLEMPGDES